MHKRDKNTIDNMDVEEDMFTIQEEDYESSEYPFSNRGVSIQDFSTIRHKSE